MWPVTFHERGFLRVSWATRRRLCKDLGLDCGCLVLLAQPIALASFNSTHRTAVALRGVEECFAVIAVLIERARKHTEVYRLARPRSHLRGPRLVRIGLAFVVCSNGSGFTKRGDAPLSVAYMNAEDLSALGRPAAIRCASYPTMEAYSQSPKSIYAAARCCITVRPLGRAAGG